MNNIKISTDTASLAFFDIEALKHRLSDNADWWDIEEDLIEEINKGNIGFCALKSDGNYIIKLVLKPIENPDVQFNLSLPSGRFFIGPGEEITGADFDPDNSKNNCGRIIEYHQGYITVALKRKVNTIYMHVVKSSNGDNCFNNEVTL